MIGGAPVAMMQQNTMPFGMQGQPQPPSFPQAYPQQHAYPQPNFPAQPSAGMRPQRLAPQQGMAPQPNYAAAPNWQPQQPQQQAFNPQTQPAFNPQAQAPTFPKVPEPAPVVRGYAQEEPAPAPTLVSLPSPSALGINSTKRTTEPTASVVPSAPVIPSVPVAAADVDWNATHQRLRQLGAVGFHLDRANQGGYRVLCVLTGQGKETQAIEGIGATEAEAVAQALARAESLRAVASR